MPPVLIGGKWSEVVPDSLLIGLPLCPCKETPQTASRRKTIKITHSLPAFVCKELINRTSALSIFNIFSIVESTKFIKSALRIMLAEACGNLVVSLFANLLLPIENKGAIDYNSGTVGILVENSVPSIICDI